MDKSGPQPQGINNLLLFIHFVFSERITLSDEDISRNRLSSFVGVLPLSLSVVGPLYSVCSDGESGRDSNAAVVKSWIPIALLNRTSPLLVEQLQHVIDNLHVNNTPTILTSALLPPIRPTSTAASAELVFTTCEHACEFHARFTRELNDSQTFIRRISEEESRIKELLVNWSDLRLYCSLRGLRVVLVLDTISHLSKHQHVGNILSGRRIQSDGKRILMRALSSVRVLQRPLTLHFHPYRSDYLKVNNLLDHCITTSVSISVHNANSLGFSSLEQLIQLSSINSPHSGGGEEWVDVKRYVGKVLLALCTALQLDGTRVSEWVDSIEAPLIQLQHHKEEKVEGSSNNEEIASGGVLISVCVPLLLGDAEVETKTTIRTAHTLCGELLLGEVCNADGSGLYDSLQTTSNQCLYSQRICGVILITYLAYLRSLVHD
jgi:hypothetical protein